MGKLKEKLIMLQSTILAGSMVLGIIGGAFFLSYLSIKDKHIQVTKTDSVSQKFDIGQHVISVPISDTNYITNKNYQFEGHPGYEPIGISLKSNDSGAILYKNVEEVQCTTDYISKDGKYCYSQFGTPISTDKDDFSKKEPNEFNVGEHILSVPIKYCPMDEELQYEVPEGYDIAGIAISTSGKYSNYHGGAILYKNVVPVNCHLDDDGYTTFGKPIEKEKVKTLNK